MTKLEPPVITELWGWERREAEKVPALLLGKDFTLQRMTRSLLGERGREEISGRRKHVNAEV